RAWTWCNASPKATTSTRWRSWSEARRPGRRPGRRARPAHAPRGARRRPGVRVLDRALGQLRDLRSRPVPAPLGRQGDLVHARDSTSPPVDLAQLWPARGSAFLAVSRAAVAVLGHRRRPRIVRLALAHDTRRLRGDLGGGATPGREGPGAAG